MKTDLDKFKSLLKYFVVHLEYCQHNHGQKEESFPSWFKDEEKEITKKIAKKSGQGYRNDAIQQQIEEWCIYPYGRVTISVQCSVKGKYTTKASYLHWDKTGLNINAEWDDIIIKYLYYRNIDSTTEEEPPKLDRNKLFSTTEEGLEELEKLYNCFVDAKKNCLTNKINTVQKLLEENYNIILTGAPGTGKTYMARQMAANIIG